ncbi:bifunctional (p)ppGpp synthetase/guanosine-3',5'-bis(diphosphate) 3'-pyrophosphohydrolase [Oxalobacter vibrioformis]|uniref:GTP pyrophosphokinase n=1 Tax=Oxalobacter vibrioformis TaxID=933080 RepID=A0A9E9P4B4_9BURK|nr:bifunctional (p)ppGpp synthetase/guanosine-3',5'-bis(diphosphate) 3'-pyrophosphohydrolase [Oxalobacter vibrioformis]WAW10918.1 bifunctional (p)ppGpp synthetase/guanosine-3',5'-bis(diphosphate) 3'-pyrophosphohydrolase [Oxalobacter vibrioformis]
MVSPITFVNVAEKITTGLLPEHSKQVIDAYEFAVDVYDDKQLDSGQPVIDFARTVGVILSTLNTDAETRIAGLLIPLPEISPGEWEKIENRYGSEVVSLVDNVRRLLKLKDISGGLLQPQVSGKNAAQFRKDQAETLRKMLLAMASDMRVVLLRLAARVAGLRYIAETKKLNEVSEHYARETLELYAPLANRLGIWQMKWELEDLSFRFLEPDAYKSIAKKLEEKRVEREEFIEDAIRRVKEELKAAGIKAEISGRPKHIYSIWNKMHGKSLDFEQMHDVRALRIIVFDIKTCFAVLDLIHRMWTPILEEFDDYISRPKPNGYQSLHTIVVAEDGQTLEVQIRTEEMHNFAEYGVASHWRYKETGGSDFAAQQQYDEKISWLRQLLSWKAEVADTVAEQDDIHSDWVRKIKATTLDDRIYVLTPQARVIDLPKGATPIDFAYQVHTDVGHRCRGVRVDGAMVPLNTPLKSGQTVEIITAKGIDAGPSRDWLTPGFAINSRTHNKIRAWFNAVEHEEAIANGRTIVDKILQREGKTSVNLEELAHKLGYAKLEEFLLAAGKDKINTRTVEQVLHGEEPLKETKTEDIVLPRKSRASSIMRGAKSGVLVVGAEGLLTQMARCCKPAPPDPIIGFVTRGKGVSIHRPECKNFLEMQKKSPERVIETDWGTSDPETVYPVDVFILAGDRQGLLRDISDIFMREKLNVIGVNTQSNKGQARMSFTAEVGSTDSLNKAIQMIREVPGVLDVKRL